MEQEVIQEQKHVIQDIVIENKKGQKSQKFKFCIFLDFSLLPSLGQWPNLVACVLSCP